MVIMVKAGYLKINLFKGELFSIQSFCLNSAKNVLCVLRKHSQYFKIEIWNLSFVPFVEKVIYENDLDLSLIESISFGPNDRLFGCSLRGILYEIDIDQGKLNQTVRLTNGPAWCLAFNWDKSLAAIGADNGISLISFANGLSDHVEKAIKNDRTLSLTFMGDKDGLVAAGSVGMIKIFDHNTLSCVGVLKIQKEAIVWSLLVLKSWVIVSGDSKGNLNFFDGRNHVLINRIASHEADILCLCKDDYDQSKIYASGVDPVISAFKLEKNDHGIATFKFHIQNHDVHCLMSHRGWLFSGGVDSHLHISNRNNRIAHCPEFSNHIQIQNEFILFQYLKHLEVWKIVSNEPSSLVPIKYIEIRSKHVIIKSGFTSTWIAYSNYDKLKVLKIEDQSLHKVPLILEPFEGMITEIKFLGAHYLIISLSTSIYILHLNKNGVLIENRFKYKKPLHIIEVCSKYLAACFRDSSFIIYNTSDWTPVVNLKLDSLPIFVRFDTKDQLFAGSSKRSVIKYNLESAKMDQIECGHFDYHLPLKGICFFENDWIIYDQSKFYYFNSEKFVKSSEMFEKILKLDYNTNSKKLIVIESTYESMIKNLPSALIKKKFGV